MLNAFGTNESLIGDDRKSTSLLGIFVLVKGINSIICTVLIKDHNALKLPYIIPVNMPNPSMLNYPIVKNSSDTSSSYSS